mmetsp:Transcript_4369/g.7665  ORF Transcript_4369/g.7665 Transcript_4369/m.7665 type:complete len:162 (+) Transcript_4369:184-669(+)
MLGASISKAKGMEANKHLMRRPHTQVTIKMLIKRHTLEVGRNMVMAKKATIRQRQQQPTLEQGQGTDRLIQAMRTPKALQSTKGKRRTEQAPEVKGIVLVVVIFVLVELVAGLAVVIAAEIGREDVTTVAETTAKVGLPIIKSLLEGLELLMWRQIKTQFI